MWYASTIGLTYDAVLLILFGGGRRNPLVRGLQIHTNFAIVSPPPFLPRSEFCTNFIESMLRISAKSTTGFYPVNR